jgi:hypothetical protein
MERRTEMEWYEEVKVDEKFSYLEADREEINTEIQLQLNYKS